MAETGARIRAAPDLLKRYLLGAFIESATAMAAQGSTGAPKGKTGKLAGSMRITVQDRGDRYEVKVGPTAFYAPWVEHGHLIGKRGHRVRARLLRRLKLTEGMARVPPHPFFFPAVDQLRAAASASIRDAIDRAERESQA